jgi:hypothetical protein
MRRPGSGHAVGHRLVLAVVEGLLDILVGNRVDAGIAAPQRFGAGRSVSSFVEHTHLVHDEQNLRHAAPRVRRQVLLPVGNGIAPRRREQHDEERGFLRRELRRRLSEIHARGAKS